MLPTNTDPAEGWSILPSADLKSVISRFAGLIRFPTVSAPGDFSLEPFHKMRNYSMHTWPEVFSALEMEIHGGASILLKWAGDPSLKPVMLAAHQDVVPTGNCSSWSHDPFGGDVSEGRIWGRGTIDYKCGFGGMLEAVSLLVLSGYKPRRTLFLAFGHDEETGGLCGAKQITDSLLSRDILCSSVLDEGGYIYPEKDGHTAEVAIAEKGYASFKLVAEAVQGHSSVPPSRTAIGTLSRGLAALEEEEIPIPDVPKQIISSKWLRTTIAPTIITSGCKENVLPGRAEAIVNTRPSPGSSVGEVLQLLLQLLEPFGIHVELIDNASVSEPSVVSSTETDDFEALKSSILATSPSGTGFRCGVFPAATDSRRYSHIADNIYRFLPVHLDRRGIGALHSIDESISISDYLKCVEFYGRYIQTVTS